MPKVTEAHFGANVILTKDNFNKGEPFAETLKEIEFTDFRYPGGGVTEDQTWANGGLERMFSKPTEPGSDNHVMTIRESLDFSSTSGKPLTIVTPTFQFFDKDTQAFDHIGFDRYLAELEDALWEFPKAKITAFEIGNEYWGSKNWGSLSGSEYGKIANVEIPKINDMIERLDDDLPDWSTPAIGIQAGVQWKAEQNLDGTWTAVGPKESAEIISEISLEHREMVSTIFQHSFPDASAIVQDLNWAVRPMNVFTEAEGFPPELTFSLSEFNIGANTAIGIDQGAAWIEGFSKAVDLGIDTIDHWGISYDWLSNKFYDTKFPPAESDNGTIVTIATPMGQIYDIAQSHLVGKATMTDAEVLETIDASEGIGVTGFEDDSQQIAFFHNATDKAGHVDLGAIPDGMHVSLRHLKPADSPHSPWFDEAARTLSDSDNIADARGDMKVISRDKIENQYELQSGEMLVLVTSDPARDLVIEGAHNVTDPASGMVDDVIVGGQGNDILRGHVGDDTIEGGGGRNVISGGKGNDKLVASDEGDVIFADGGDTVVGGDGDDLIFSGTGAGAASGGAILGGKGSDIFLIGAGSSVDIEDLSDEDQLGFGGAFADAATLHEASHAEGEDLVITMPDGSQVLLAGRAGQADSLHEQVLDFQTSEQILETTDSYLSELTHQEIAEIFRQKEESFQTFSHQEDLRYFDDLEATAARLDIDQPVKEAPQEEFPNQPGDNPDDEPDYPTVPPKEDDTPEHEPTDPQDEAAAHDLSGGACFVATAAYGDPEHFDVVALRAFRDNHLVKAKLGRAFIRFYWIVGPKIARVTQPNNTHALLARWCLSRIVRRLRILKLTADR